MYGDWGCILPSGKERQPNDGGFQLWCLKPFSHHRHRPLYGLCEHKHDVEARYPGPRSTKSSLLSSHLSINALAHRPRPQSSAPMTHANQNRLRLNQIFRAGLVSFLFSSSSYRPAWRALRVGVVWVDYRVAGGCGEGNRQLAIRDLTSFLY